MFETIRVYLVLPVFDVDEFGFVHIGCEVPGVAREGDGRPAVHVLDRLNDGEERCAGCGQRFFPPDEEVVLI